MLKELKNLLFSMQNSGATFQSNQQPVLPFADLLSQKTVKQLVPLAIGKKIKSFEIKDSDVQIESQGIEIQLLQFAALDSIPRNYKTIVVESFNLASHSQQSLGTVKRYWWQWLISAKEKIAVFVMLILLQSSTHARNLLDEAKIYVDLDSQAALNVPSSGRVHLENSQASPFNRAIQKAREIERDSPFYPQAQIDINRWSETILDIAKGRAEQEDFMGAIAAVKLMPQDHNSTKLLAREASAVSEDWQRRVLENYLYQRYLIEAKAIINPSQASSYSRAIVILKQIDSTSSEYTAAQSKIDQWNKEIYLIAKHRAEQANFKQAIESAILVSEDSRYYQLAQDSINNKIKSIFRANNN